MFTTSQRDGFRLATLTAIAASAPHGLDIESLFVTHLSQSRVAIAQQEYAEEVEALVSLGWLSKRAGVLNKNKYRYHLTDAGQTVLVQHGLT